MNIGIISAIRFEESSQRAIPAIGLYYLASYVEKNEPDISVKVYRTPAEVIKAKPDLVGISAVTENMITAEKWARLFREKLSIPIILGGNHISALPHTLPETFDIGVIGEGEETFLEMVRLFKNDNNWQEKLPFLDGISFHQQKKVIVNKKRPSIEPLEKLPYPRREKEVWGRFHYCFSSRGCPYHCTFCSPKVIWKTYRPFPAEYVVGELKEIIGNFNPTYIHFFDDLFIGDRQRIKHLTRMIRRHGYNRMVGFGGHIRADLIDDEICRDLRRMNFVSGSFGAESSSDRILKFLKAGTTTVEMNQRAIDICFRNGIQLNLSFIIGTPGETKDDIEKTIRFIEQNEKKMMGIEIFIVLPYPGTPLWNWCKRRHLVSEDMNWDLFKTKAFFSEFDVNENFLYINEAMDRETFIKYVKVFQDIDAGLNRNNLKIYEYIEKEVPCPIDPKSQIYDSNPVTRNKQNNNGGLVECPGNI